MIKAMKNLRRVLRGIAIIGVVVSSYGFYFYFNNDDSLAVTSYEVSSSKYTGTKDFTIVQLSDFHNHPLRYANAELLTSIQTLSPDIIVCTGDFIDNHTRESDFTRMETMLASWQGLGIPVYYVAGNHELYAPADLRQREYAIFNAHGARYLSKSCVDLKNGLVLNGIRDPGKNKVDGAYDTHNVGDVPAQLEKLKTGFDAAKFNVMLCHRPDLFNLIYHEGYDLTLSGHTHGGQILLGSWALAVYPWTEYVAGEYARDASKLIVSRGLGTSYNLPMRYRCQAEITLITIKRQA